MRIVNIMNFVRQIDERFMGSTDVLYETTKRELALINEFGLKATFLLQYDALCDERFVSLFRDNASESIELGIWYEIVEPLTTACDMPYRSERGWKWDWHIVPGFSMAYEPSERERLLDEAMRKFKELFGQYPRSFASWVIDTHTLNYLCEHYDIDYVGICRDQTSTDAYTLVGGYFNGAYYPSKYNMFTPAQTEENQQSVPVFRLLGPCPVHNYDNTKYMSDSMAEAMKKQCFTLEPFWKTGSTPAYVDWFFHTYFDNEDLGFSYAQLGQENSFGRWDFLPALRMQLQKLCGLKHVTVETTAETGARFKRTFDRTPPTAIVADNSWDKEADVQSVYYDSKYYTANLFRYGRTVLLRSLYLFNELVKDRYLCEPCTSFDAVYENLPLVDTLSPSFDSKERCGLVLCDSADRFTVQKDGQGRLSAVWEGGSITFDEAFLTVSAPVLRFYTGASACVITPEAHALSYQYRGVSYTLLAENADVQEKGDHILILPHNGTCRLIPQCHPYGELA